MKCERSPTTYLTLEEIRQIAAKLSSDTIEQLARSAENFRSLAEFKGGYAARPPK